MALVMGLAAVACQPAAENAEATDEATAEVAPKAKKAKDFVPSKKTVDEVSYLVGINFGSFIKGYNFGDLNYAQIKKGMDDFINAKGNQMDPDFAEQFRVDPNRMNELFNEFLQNRRDYLLYSNKEAGEKFFAKNGKKPGVVTSASGLQYKIISAGNEVKPCAVDTVWVKYKGSLLDGTVFDETPADGDAISFTLNRVVRGWTEGLQYIGEGGEIELYIPSSLGYGDSGNQRIEPGATLVFNVSLEKVGKAE